jgi:hypothetical protein
MSLHESQISNISGMSTPTANAARLANNKRIVFTDQVEIYKNFNEGTATATGINSAGMVNNKARVGTTEKLEDVQQA